MRKQILREDELVVSPTIFALFLVVFGFTTGEFVVAGILPDVAAGDRKSVV